MKNLNNNSENISTIVLGGGCFWGVEHYFKQIEGVIKTDVAYVNGNTLNPSYEDVCSGNTLHVEAVTIDYDTNKVSLNTILNYFFKIIDPTLLNKQGNDVGTQYRTGIYYLADKDKITIDNYIESIRKNYNKEIVTEVKKLENISLAENYHQDYLEKNPNGYCHISFDSLPKYDKNKKNSEKQKGPSDTLNDNGITDVFDSKYTKKSDEDMKKEFTPLQYEVTQNSHTEAPHTSEYSNLYSEGIYVDITTGQPLFSSSEKFDSGCGWPSFSKPIDNKLIKEYEDLSLGRVRTEVKSARGDSHLGHVFNDGPMQLGGLRYCINGAALKFIKKDDLEKNGYGYLLKLFNNN